MTIQAAIAYIQGLAEGLTGIRQAPDFPPEQMNVFPFAVCYPSVGEFRAGPIGLMKGCIAWSLRFTWRGRIYRATWRRRCHSENCWPRPCLTILPWAEPSTQCADEGITYTFGALAWGGQETVGWRLTIPVKIQTVL